MFVVPGCEVGSQKRQARRVVKKCTNLLYFKDLEVKSAKNCHSRGTRKLNFFKGVKTSRDLTISKSTVSKTVSLGALLEVELWQKCPNAPCLNDLEVKGDKKLSGSDQFWKLNFQKIAKRLMFFTIGKSNI